jgi:DNA (cytosine-5)-methyltransferase 1
VNITMPTYTCFKCNKSFNRKSHHVQHMKRKTPCAKNDEDFTIVETFVGAGGAHLGFKRAGFKTLFVNDIDSDTINTLIQNSAVHAEQCITCPIEDLSESMIREKCGGKTPDVLFGGIVCKGFSLAGVRNPFDERNYLYRHQLRLVDILRPKVSVIENVTAIKTMYLYQKCDETIHAFSEYTELSDQNKQLNGEKSSRRKNNEDYSELNVRINENKRSMQQLLDTIEKYRYNVIDDIKAMYERLGYRFYEKILQTDKYGGYTNRKRVIMVAVRNDIDTQYEFPDELNTNYTIQDAFNLIDYAGTNNPQVDEDNKPMKHAEKTVERFKLIPEGDNIASVIDELPEDLKISAFYSRGNTQRLNRNAPAPTLVPGHSNFPIHPWEHRSITVREAATITGFPTNYNFFGSHTSRCIQIGNAVPVQLAYHIALSIKRLLNAQSTAV